MSRPVAQPTSIRRRSINPTRKNVSGAVVAYALIDSRNLGRVLDVGTQSREPELESGIEGGLLNTLALMAWTRPGAFAALKPRSERARGPVGHSEERSEEAGTAGLDPPLVA